MDIKGSVAVVTGGNRGIGEAFVRVLLQSGRKKVYAGSRDPKSAAHLVKEFPDRCVAIELDVTDGAEIEAAARSVQRREYRRQQCRAVREQAAARRTRHGAARQEMEVNYFGTLAMCRAFAPVLGRNGGGAIVNVLSAAALTSIPNMGGYGPSKAATRSLSGAVRAELAPQGTQVTALIVGSVDTRMAAHVEGGKEKPGGHRSCGPARRSRAASTNSIPTAWPSKCARRCSSIPKGWKSAWRKCCMRP